MSFFGEMASLVGYDEARRALGYDYAVYNGEAVFVTGVKRILRVDASELALAVPHGVLYIVGSELRLAESEGADVLVRGNIFGVVSGDGKERLSVGAAK